MAEQQNREQDYNTEAEQAQPAENQPAKPAKTKAKIARKEKYRYEKELVKEGKIVPRYAPRSKFGRILAVLLAFFFGMFVALGALVGAGVYIGTRKLKDGLSLLSIDYSDYLTDTAAELTIAGLISDITSTSWTSLSAIAKYTPLLETMLNKANEQLSELGITLDVDELLEVEFSNLGTYFQEEVLYQIELGGVLGVDASSDALMVSICYGTEGADYTIVNGEIVMNEGCSPTTIQDLVDDASGIITGVALCDVLGIDASSDAIMIALCYGTEGADYEIVDGEIVMLGDATPTTIADLTEGASDLITGIALCDVLGIDASSDTLMISLCYGTEGVDYEIVDGEIVMLGDATPTTIGDLSEDASGLLGKITIEDACGVSAESDAAIRYIAYGTYGICYTITDGEIVMLTNPVTGETYEKKTLDDLTADGANIIGGANIGDLVDIDENSSGFLAAVKSWSLDDLQENNRIMRLKIGQIIDIGENSSLLMQALADWRLEELTDQSAIESLTLSDILTIDESSAKLLQSLSDTAIGELSDSILSLRLIDILDEDDLAKNNLLKNVTMSTLDTLADDIQNLTVEEVLGDDLYSYLALGTDGTGDTYATLISNYDPSDETKSATRPSAISADNKVKAEKKYWRTDESGSYIENGEVSLGWFTEDESFVDEGDVYAEETEDEDGNTIKTYFTQEKLRLSASAYTWYTYDYSAGALVSLPEGGSVVYSERDLDSVGSIYTYACYTEDETQAVVDGSYCYYVSADGDYYPVMEDSFSYYYRYYDGEGDVVRVDLDRVVTAYTTADGTSLSVQDGGTVLYGGASYTVYSGTDEDGNFFFIKIKETVSQSYYTCSDTNVYTLHSDGVVTRYYGEWTENGVEHAEWVDRYLNGVPWLIFGGVEYDENGNVTEIVDKTDMQLLDIGSLLNDTSSKVGDLALWELYLHELIDTNPYQQLPYTDDDETPYSNMNEMTINVLLVYTKSLISQQSNQSGE